MSNWDNVEKTFIRTVLGNGRKPDNSAKFPEVEHALIKYLTQFIPERVGIDVGAFRGAYTRVLRDCGFQVFTFEPTPSRVADLRAKWRDDPGVHSERVALSDQDGLIDINLGAWQVAGEEDLNPGDLFNSLEVKPWNELLAYPLQLSIVRRRLAWFVDAGIIPAEIGMLKVDTEGHDKSVLEGAWPHIGRLTMCEYWNHQFVMSNGKAENDLSNYEDFFASRADVHKLVIGRDTQETALFFQVDPRTTETHSWGNIFFTRDPELFAKAVEWCMSVMGARACRA